MKATSSKGENKKRKRDESQEIISESPKKAKVHAQRKFAQGAAFNSPVITPIKDKVRPPSSVPTSGPMLTTKCPNTEDFLTFLCFRRTSILPAKLDFFKDGFGSEPELPSSVASHKNNSEHYRKQSIKRGDKVEDSKKSQAQTVQALKKKYQEQRLAKQKVSNVTKLAQKVKGKNMVRTRSSGVAEESEKEVLGRESKSNPSGLRSGLKRVLPPANKTKKKVGKGKHLRSGLRSRGISVREIPEKSNQATKAAVSSVKKLEKNKKGKAEGTEIKGRSVKLKRVEGFSDFSSDDNEPLLAVKKPKTGGRNMEKVGINVGRGERSVKTRSQISELMSSRVSMRPTRKTKEAAAIYMEMITKKLVSPEKSGDDDVSSVDSFPELPNAKRNEQRETEIKAKAFASFGSKKIEPKQQAEATGKETKKIIVKKTEFTVKLDPKSPEEVEGFKKANQKKEAKAIGRQEDWSASGKKTMIRRSLKGETPKGKQKEEEKKEVGVTQTSRPSTRSRHQEDAEVAVKKVLARVSSTKTPKPVIKDEEKEKNKIAKSAKKPKATKNLNATPKNKAEHGDGGCSENKKGVKKACEKEAVKEEKENSGKRDKKSAVEKEVEKKKGKLKERVGERKKGRREAKEGGEEGNPVSKRPTRKCSTADKIWIDIDGFTSDEEDFVDVAQVTKTRASAKKAKDASGSKPEEKIGGGNKWKSDKTKDSEKEKDTLETRKIKSEKKDESSEGKTKENLTRKIETVKKGESKPGSVQTAKEKTEPKGTSKRAPGSTERPSGSKEADKQKIVFDVEGDKKRREESGKKREAPAAEEASLDLNSEKKREKRGRGTGPGKEEKNEGGREEEGEEESSGGRGRRRPVRQCSTGEKRWIESDSDSFSFYESSDDEDDLPIVDFGAKNSSPSTATETKESKTVEGSEKEISVPEKKSEDYFSESDEEPLKKKALLLGDEISKPSGSQPEAGKTQREMPGLHPLKKIPSETAARTSGLEAVLPVPAAAPKVGVVRLPLTNAFVMTEPKILIHDSKNFEGKPEVPGQVLWTKEEHISEPRGNFLMQGNESPVVSVPNKIEMILHTLKKEKMGEGNAGYSNNVKVTFGNVPYNPVSYPIQPRINQVPCTYQIKTVNFPPPREPISTHGLDLLSEVALPTTPKGKMTSPTERIEKWLNDSLAAEQKKRFPGFPESSECRGGEGEETSKAEGEKSQSEVGLYYGNSASGPGKANQSSHVEIQKFGQVELLESQKLLKKNLFSTESKQEGLRAEQQATAPKKALTSVQDLLKLQKERRDVVKASADNSPHLKNCKCNNCIVKKGWFKNKPVPKTDHHKSSPVEDCDESAKPFESLTKAFNKISGEGKNSKMSVSVAPMVVSSPSSSLKPSQDAANPSPAREGTERKGIFHQRKLSFLERMKERERKEAAAVKPSPNAFSPNNESSVYAFEPEPEQSPSVNAPFRSKTRESRTSSASKSDDEGLKICEDEPSTVVAVSRSQTEKTTCASKASQSASIAVQVNLDSENTAEIEAVPETQDGKSIEISTQTEVPEEDSDSPMFYIPLQQARAAGASDSSDRQLIQGVALKLGTEGPMGPNQRVIMKAKLVTKPPDTPSIKAVVMPQPKRMFDQKNNNPPIGTVQPTTRKPPEVLPEGQNASKSSETNLLPSTKPSPLPSKGEVPSEEASLVEPEAFSPKTTKSSGGAFHGKPSGKSKEKISVSGSREKAEASDEHSPCSSAASSSSKSTKRATKQKCSESAVTPSNSTWLPPGGTPSKLVEAPTFHPTEKDFQDPFEFFDRIRPAAEKFGLCRIVPPSTFKPDCKVSDDMRFTAYNQYVHRMFHRWGPNVKEMMAIKKYLTTQSISLKQPPWIGGIEVDLPRLYQSVQNCGGLMKVMEKKKWNQVADAMKIPKAAQDRVTKLDDIYCKYLLPYDTLSHDERQKLFDEVDKDWLERQQKPAESQNEEEAEDENYIEECEECVVKGRNMALNQFYRIARNTMSMWFRSPEPSPREVENEYWRHVRERNHHVCVHSGSIDSSGWGYGFPVAKNNSFSKHPWNLKVLTNNCGSVLRSLGPVMGVTVPTLHVGMVFAAFCWYRDPHGLPWIEYLHTGAPKIWYGISDDNSTVFQEALSKLLPRYIKNKTIWLPSDTAMVPPDLLVEHGVSLCHTIQEPGQFILVFPRAFTSSICTGYLVSESVYFAQPSWLATAEQAFKDIQESCEPSMFSLEKLLFSIATDSRSSVEVLKQVLPMVWHVRQKEIDTRKTLCNLGLKPSERLPSRELGNKKKKGRWAREDDGDYECEVCRMNLYVSLVINSHEEGVYCLPHAIDLLTQKRHHLKYCKLMYTYTQEEMNEMIEKLEQRIENKSQKKSQGKSSSNAK